MANWVNSVPQGRTGTGNATVFDNNLAQQFGNQISNLRERERQQALLQQREAEKMAQSFRDNQLAASEGRLWADQVGKIEQDHIQRGIDLKQRGIDPYGSSKDALDYQKERRQVQSQQGYRKAQEAQYNTLIKQIQTKGVENFEPEDIANLNKFVSEGKLSDAYSGNLQLPAIRERFSPATLLKDVKAITQNDVDVNGNIKSDKKFINTKATQEAIIGRLNADPRGQQFIQKITGGIPVNDLLSIPKTFEANRDEILKEYKGNPDLRKKLALDAGITGEGEKLNAWVDQIARVRSNARTNFDSQMDNFVANASQGVQLWDKETPDMTMANYDLNRQRVDISRQNANRLASQGSGGGNGVNPTDFNVTPKEFKRAVQRDKNTQELIPGSDKVVAVFDKFTTVNPTSFGTSQLKTVYDVEEGKNVSMNAKGSVELVGIGYTKVKGGGYKLKATIVDSDGKEFFINETDLPLDVRNDKYYKSAKSALGSAPKQSTTKPAPTKAPTKTVTTKRTIQGF